MRHASCVTFQPRAEPIKAEPSHVSELYSLQQVSGRGTEALEPCRMPVLCNAACASRLRRLRTSVNFNSVLTVSIERARSETWFVSGASGRLSVCSIGTTVVPDPLD